MDPKTVLLTVYGRVISLQTKCGEKILWKKVLSYYKSGNIHLLEGINFLELQSCNRPQYAYILCLQ